MWISLQVFHIKSICGLEILSKKCLATVVNCAIGSLTDLGSLPEIIGVPFQLSLTRSQIPTNGWQNTAQTFETRMEAIMVLCEDWKACNNKNHEPRLRGSGKISFLAFKWVLVEQSFHDASLDIISERRSFFKTGGRIKSTLCAT